jgi:hypothetical protein
MIQHANDGMIRLSGFMCLLSFRLSHCQHFKNGQVLCCAVVCHDLEWYGWWYRSDSVESGSAVGRVVSTLCSSLCLDVVSGTAFKRTIFLECVTGTSVN